MESRKQDSYEADSEASATELGSAETLPTTSNPFNLDSEGQRHCLQCFKKIV